MKDTIIGATIIVLMIVALWYVQDAMVIEVDGIAGVATPVGGW